MLKSSNFNWVSIPEFDLFNLDNTNTVGFNESVTSMSSSTGEIINIMEIVVNRSANAIMSPVERGHYVFDNKVIMPITVDVKIKVAESHWENVWGKMLKMYNNRSYSFYEVCTRGELIKNLMLVGIPRHEIADQYDCVDLTLKFVEVIYASEDRRKASDPSNNTTVSTGQKTMKAKQ